MKIIDVLNAVLAVGSGVIKKTFSDNETIESVNKKEYKDNIKGKSFDHQVLTIEESRINRLLRAAIRRHWFFHSVIIEFEPNNNVYMGAISKLGNVMSANFTIEDVWFDDYTTSFEIKVDVSSLDTGYFITNTIVHIMGKWLMSFLGTFFNPFSICKDGSNMRFDKNGSIRFDMPAESSLRSCIIWPERNSESSGPVLVYNPKTMQAAISLDYYSFYEPEEKYQISDVPKKTSWLHSIDWLALLLLPIGVWLSFVLLHRYLPPATLQSFSWSFYFWMSLGMLWLSFMVMNIPRYIYMYIQGRKKWQSVLLHNNITIQMRRLQRRIITQQAELKQDSLMSEEEYQDNIHRMLLQIRDKRFLLQRLKLVDEDHLRKQKVKFIIAYILCTLFEWILLVR